ncbi:MAG: hypothetical protein MH321_18630 [Leptospiraceae bacterium]|nr:hypothetical protein [Leptospiraceae bacterium]
MGKIWKSNLILLLLLFLIQCSKLTYHCEDNDFKFDLILKKNFLNAEIELNQDFFNKYTNMQSCKNIVQDDTYKGILRNNEYFFSCIENLYLLKIILKGSNGYFSVPNIDNHSAGYCKVVKHESRQAPFSR